MKSLLIIIAFFFTCVSQDSFASSPNVSKLVLQSFESYFKIKDNVQWTEVGGLYKASFIYRGQAVSAFYNASGEQVAVGRQLNTEQLPFALQLSLQEEYPGYTISDLFEVIQEEGCCYYVTVQNGKQKLVLEGFDSKYWRIYKKLNIKN